MKKLLISIWLAVLAPCMAYGDIFEFSEYGGGRSGAGKSEWLLLDDDRDPTTDPYPWGMTATCDGKGSYEFAIALHGIVSGRPRAVDVEYKVGDGETVATQGFALDSILTGLSKSLGTDLSEAVSLGLTIVLGVTGESATWSTTFEGYDPDPDRVEFVSGGCR